MKQSYISQVLINVLEKQGYSATAAYIRSLKINGVDYVSDDMVEQLMEHEKGTEN